MKIFVSHSERDRALASSLGGALETHGHELVRPGLGSAPAEYVAAVCSADAVVVILAKPSENNLVELGLALGAGRPVLVFGASDALTLPYAATLPSVPKSDSDVLDFRRIALALDGIRDRKPAGGSREIPVSSLEELVANPEALAALPYKRFEDLVLQWFRGRGIEVERTRAAEDRGFDLRGRHQGVEFFVEVKKTPLQARLSTDIVRRLAHTLMASGGARGILLTTSPLTSAAAAIARESNISVYLLDEWVRLSSFDEVVSARQTEDSLVLQRQGV